MERIHHIRERGEGWGRLKTLGMDLWEENWVSEKECSKEGEGRIGEGKGVSDVRVSVRDEGAADFNIRMNEYNLLRRIGRGRNGEGAIRRK